MPNKPGRTRRALVTGALVAGTTLGAAGIASAATSSGSTPTSGSATATAPSSGSNGTPPAGAPDPATVAHGPNETLLTGSDLQSATAAATKAVPGATVIRAETNSSGASPYEVHMKKSDGTYVTVELNSSFGVVATVSGFGGGPAGSAPPNGAPPNGASPTSGA